MYVTVLPTLSTRFLHFASAETLLQSLGTDGQYFRFGRDALYVGLEALGLRADDVVLVPGSMCDAVLLAFGRLKISVRYYDLDATLSVPVENLSRELCERTRADYVNHYFGLETEFAAVVEFCRTRGLLLIEDCAHILPNHKRRPGSWGDISIFSPRKMLPIPDGGFLKINGSARLLERRMSGRLGFLRTAKLVASELALVGLLPVSHFKTRRNAIDSYLSIQPDFSNEAWQPPTAISAISRWLGDRFNLEEIRSARRRNYLAVSCWTRQNQELGLSALRSDLTDGAAPYSFPLIVKTGRNEFIVNAAREGIYLEPTFVAPYRNAPGVVNSLAELPVVRKLSRMLVSVPVHQSLTQKRMHKVLAKLSRALSKSHGHERIGVSKKKELSRDSS